MRIRLRWVLGLPEANVAIFAFLLNFAWEVLQTPFFYSATRLQYPEAVKACLLATIGDVGIAIASFWSVAVAVRTRQWILTPSWRQLAGLVGVGVAITIGFERLALSAGRWVYSESMPVVPLINVGAVPLLQWVVLPLLTVWFVRRQLT